MARFESPCQILILFLGALAVSLAVIYLLRVEATKRYGNDESSNADSAIRSDSVDGLRTRVKRSTADTSDEEEDEDENASDDDGLHPSPLSKQLLSEASNHRKVRNVGLKVRTLRKDDQIVRAILDQFCKVPLNVLPSLNTLVDLVSKLETTKTTTTATTKKKALHPLPPAAAMVNSGPHLPYHESVCHSKGQVIVAVIFTTFVNFAFVGLIAACKRCICSEDQFEEDDKEQLVSNGCPCQHLGTQMYYDPLHELRNQPMGDGIDSQSHKAAPQSEEVHQPLV